MKGREGSTLSFSLPQPFSEVQMRAAAIWAKAISKPETAKREITVRVVFVTEFPVVKEAAPCLNVVKTLCHALTRW